MMEKEKFNFWNWCSHVLVSGVPLWLWSIFYGINTVETSLNMGAILGFCCALVAQSIRATTSTNIKNFSIFIIALR